MGQMARDWHEVAGNWLWVPHRPKGIVHFLGGAFVASAPHLTYRLLLEALGQAGYLIIATPFVNTFDHRDIAQEIAITFDQALHYLEARGLPARTLPIYGLGHSMGCKMHVLLGSGVGQGWGVSRQRVVGNILMAFNNYSARRSIPLLEQFVTMAPALDVEFTPTPTETLALVRDRYQVPQNFLIRFTKDDIDETRTLAQVLMDKYPDHTAIARLPGTHTTPLAQSLPWQPGRNFSPLDALGQWVQQEFSRDAQILYQEILAWLEP